MTQCNSGGRGLTPPLWAGPTVRLTLNHQVLQDFLQPQQNWAGDSVPDRLLVWSAALAQQAVWTGRHTRSAWF